MVGLSKEFSSNVIATTGGNSGGYINISKISSQIDSAVDLCKDIHRAQKWLDQQWQLKCTEPDGDAYWDLDEPVATTVDRQVSDSNTPMRSDPLRMKSRAEQIGA